MPPKKSPYICEKCGHIFAQKSGYDDHMARKTDCSVTTVINDIVEKKVKKAVKEAIKEEVGSVVPAPLTKDEKSLQKFFEDLHNLLWNKAGLNPEKALDHMTFFFAYRLIEPQITKLGLPDECRWSYIAQFKNENDLFEIVKKGFNAFATNPITKPFFKKHEIVKAMVLHEIVQHINKIPIETLRETDTLGDIFEYMLGRGMSTMSDDGQYFTDRRICNLAFKYAYKIKKSLRRPDGTLCTFADWFCGTGGFPASYIKGVNANIPDIDWTRDCKSIMCQDMNMSSVTTTLLNLLILTGIPFSANNIRCGNSFADPIFIGESAPFKGSKIDYCFMNPPYGGDKTKGKEYKFAYTKGKGDAKKYLVNEEIRSIGIEDDDKVSAGVQLGMASLSDDGVGVLVLPQGFFFGATKKCVDLRKKLLEEFKIHYIIDIHSGAFQNTGTKTSMIVFQKGCGPTEKIQFIDLNENHLCEATADQLKDKNYSLNYKQYIKQSIAEVEGFEMIKLGDICQLISGYAFKSDSFTTNTSDLRVLKIKNIKDHKVVFDENDDRYVYINKLEKFVVNEGEFVIAMTGATTGKVGIHTTKEKVLLNQRVGKFVNFKSIFSK